MAIPRTKVIPGGSNSSQVSDKHIKELQDAILNDELAHRKQEDHEKFVQNLQRQETALKSEIETMEKALANKKEGLLDLQREIAAGADFHYDTSDSITIEVAKETLARLESQRRENNVIDNRNNMIACKYCKQPAVFDPSGHGWTHKDGGIYTQKCETCGWIGSKIGSYQACPKCGESNRLIDDHCILVYEL